MTATPKEVTPVNLSYDLWSNDRWIGMTSGPTPTAARLVAINSLGDARMAKVIMTPFMGLGTSEETYKAITGRDCIS